MDNLTLVLPLSYWGPQYLSAHYGNRICK